MLRKKLFYNLHLSLSTLALTGLIMGQPVQAMEGERPNEWARIAELVKAKESGRETANEMNDEEIEDKSPSRVPAGYALVENMVEEEESSWENGEDISSLLPQEADLLQDFEDKNPSGGLDVLCQAIEYASNNSATTTTTTTVTTITTHPPMGPNSGMNPYHYGPDQTASIQFAPPPGVILVPHGWPYNLSHAHFQGPIFGIQATAIPAPIQYGWPHAPGQVPGQGFVPGLQQIIPAPIPVVQQALTGKKRKFDGAPEAQENKRINRGVSITLGELMTQLQDVKFERVFTEINHIKLSLSNHDLMIHVEDLESYLFPSLPMDRQNFLARMRSSLSHCKQVTTYTREAYVMLLNHGIHHQPSQMLIEYMADCNKKGYFSFSAFKKKFIDSLGKKGQRSDWKYPASINDPIFPFLKPATSDHRGTLNGKKKEQLLVQCLAEGKLFDSFMDYYLNVRYLLLGTNGEDANSPDLVSQGWMVPDISVFILSILVKDLMMDEKIYLYK